MNSVRGSVNFTRRKRGVQVNIQSVYDTFVKKRGLSYYTPSKITLTAVTVDGETSNPVISGIVYKWYYTNSANELVYISSGRELMVDVDTNWEQRVYTVTITAPSIEGTPYDTRTLYREVEPKDGTDGEHAKTIKLTASSEVVKVNKDGSVTPSTINVDYRVNNTEIEYKEFYIDGEWIAKPTWIEDQGNSFLINVSHSNALFETLTIILLDDIGNRDSITITRMKDGTSVSILGSKNDPYELPSQQDGAKMGDAYIINGYLWVYDGVTTLTEATEFWNNVGRIKGDKGDAGSNYLVLGYWSEEYEYQQSDAGIPVVKRPGSGDEFLAYKLIVPKSTEGHFYNSSNDPRIEWELVASSEFIYMLEAYIEVLQAELITAEKIVALDIVHPLGRYSLIDGKLKVQEAEIEGTVNATSGSFKGHIEATSGTITDVTLTNITGTNANFIGAINTPFIKGITPQGYSVNSIFTDELDYSVLALPTGKSANGMTIRIINKRNNTKTVRTPPNTVPVYNGDNSTNDNFRHDIPAQSYCELIAFYDGTGNALSGWIVKNKIALT